MHLVKLGGSVITYKGERQRFRTATMAALATELAPFREDLCIVHGGGSFGHPGAYRHGLHRGMKGAAQRAGFAEVQRRMRGLNGRVLDALHAEGVPAVSLPPAPLVKVRDGEVLAFQGDPFLAFLEAGLVPVTFGDAVLDAGQGSAILSGDEIMVQLARILRPEAAIFVGDVEGVRGPDGALLRVVTAPLERLARDPDAHDVTGGLGGKLEAMLSIAREGTPTSLLSGLVPGRLRDALAGKSVPGTAVRPD